MDASLYGLILLKIVEEIIIMIDFVIKKMGVLKEKISRCTFSPTQTFIPADRVFEPIDS